MNSLFEPVDIEDDYSAARQILILQIAEKLPQLGNYAHRSLAEFILSNNLCTEPPEMDENWVKSKVEHLCYVYEEAQKNGEVPILRYGRTYSRNSYNETPIMSLEDYENIQQVGLEAYLSEPDPRDLLSPEERKEYDPPTLTKEDIKRRNKDRIIQRQDLHKKIKEHYKKKIRSIYSEI